MAMKKKGAILVMILVVVALVAAGCSSKETGAAPVTFVVHGDTINSHLVQEAICVQNSRFQQGQRLVFRATVNDVATGKLIEDAKVKVVLGNGEEIDLPLGEHGDTKTKLYAIGYTIPDDFPTGTMDIKYVAEVNGKTATFEPFDVAASKFTVLAKAD